MAGLLNAGLYLIDTLFHLYIWVLILRVLLQQFKADPYNPISQIIGQLTRIPVGTLQQFIPRYQRFDVAATLYAIVVSWVYVQVVYSFLNQPLGTGQGLWLALREFLEQVLNVYTGSLFVYVLLSWVGPGMNNPAGSILWSINEPLLRPVRRVLPPYSGLDFSPLLVILALQVVRIILASA
jgi:YggT family protein